MRLLPAGSRLILATHNQGKLAELQTFLAPYDLEIISAGALGLTEPAETGESFPANAQLKARDVAKQADMPALADDSGLEVTALGGRPGVHSAQWGGKTGDFNQAMRRIFMEMPPGSDPAACFVCVLCLAWPDSEEKTACFTGKTPGRVIWPPRGKNGFGYDPIFIPQGETRTFSEMEPEEKDSLSHRRRAFGAFAQACLPAFASSPT